MQFVTKENLNTARFECAVTGRTDDPEGFFDARRNLVYLTTGNERKEQDIRSTISMAAFKEMARMKGYRSPEDIEALEARLDAMGRELDSLGEYVAKLETFKTLEKELVPSAS